MRISPKHSETAFRHYETGIMNNRRLRISWACTNQPFPAKSAGTGKRKGRAEEPETIPATHQRPPSMSGCAPEWEYSTAAICIQADMPSRKERKTRLKRRSLNRTRYGHWESDTIVSGKNTGSKVAGSVAYERKAKYTETRKIPNLKPCLHNRAVTDMLHDKKALSLSEDNGIENTKHEELGIPLLLRSILFLAEGRGGERKQDDQAVYSQGSGYRRIHG